MKKLLILLVLGLVLVSGGILAFDCVDSDKGKYYYIRGKITFTSYYSNGEDLVYEDSCGEEENYTTPYFGYAGPDRYKILHETYCNKPDIWDYQEDYKCPYGCLNGSCLDTQEEADRIIKEEIEKGKRREQIISICEDLSYGESQYECYTHQAIKNKEPIICSKISDPFKIKDCYVEVATVINDSSVCLLSDEWCFILFEVKIKNISYCENRDDSDIKKECFRLMAMELGDISLCDKVGDECYYDFALQKKDNKLCEKILDEEERINCKNDTAPPTVSTMLGVGIIIFLFFILIVGIILFKKSTLKNKVVWISAFIGGILSLINQIFSLINEGSLYSLLHERFLKEVLQSYLLALSAKLLISFMAGAVLGSIIGFIIIKIKQYNKRERK